ncbi:MAG: hypothetical protein LBB08_00165 [Rickettsiales bacterium]|jgi:outer membrane protein assembly factor BamB|nr:hypothetical protein [Rickettsiales bacterium]
MKIKCAVFLVAMAACGKSDPILPGVREPVFKGHELAISGKKHVSDLGDPITTEQCNCRIDEKNQIFCGKKRIFRGFATESVVSTPNGKKPLCSGGFVYGGLSTGELVKVSPSGYVEWAADIFSEFAPTGGAPFLDIVARPAAIGGFIYAGGLGDAFCKLRDKDGEKIWCLRISVQSIRINRNFIVVEAADGKVYAVSADNGRTYDLEGNENDADKLSADS